MKAKVVVIQKAVAPRKEPPAANIKKRPVHKENLRLAMVAAELNKKHPEPMSIMHRRETAGEIPKFALPKPEVTLGMQEKAAIAMAAWDNSDPFSYGRTVLYVRQGYLDPKEVIKEMEQRTLARRVAKAREVDNETSKSRV